MIASWMSLLILEIDLRRQQCLVQANYSWSNDEKTLVRFLVARSSDDRASGLLIEKEIFQQRAINFNFNRTSNDGWWNWTDGYRTKWWTHIDTDGKTSEQKSALELHSVQWTMRKEISRKAFIQLRWHFFSLIQSGILILLGVCACLDSSSQIFAHICGEIERQ